MNHQGTKTQEEKKTEIGKTCTTRHQTQRREKGSERAFCGFLLSGFFSVSLCLGGVTLFSQVKPSAPTSRSAQQAFILRAQTNEVLVDVHVYDKSGKPVTI